MKSIVTNAAAVSVLRLIDETLKSGGGPISIGATVIRASKGPVNAVTPVVWSDWEQYFGKPLSKKAGPHMEGLRQLADAAAECNYCNVVRVVAADARFPSITFKLIDDKGSWAATTDYVIDDVVTITGGDQLICITDHTSGATEPTGPDTNWAAYTDPSEKSEHAYGTTMALGSGKMMMLWPVDGDPSTNRKVTITNVDNDNQRFRLNFYDVDENGETYLLEWYVVGINPDDRDDMGRTAFIETVLEERSDIFRCKWDETLAWADVTDTLDDIADITFEGGTNGGEPTTQDWIDAWDLFRNESNAAYLMFAAGNYDNDVLANCIDIAEARHVSFFFDVPDYLDAEAARLWLNSAGLESRQAAAYYCPWAANDRWYGGKTVWGASGAAVAACAKGDANMSGATPGVHYSPAGVIRAKLSRTGLQHLFPADKLDRDKYYDARINPVVAGENGGAVIDDSLAIHYKQNYSRFVWVNRIANYIDHRFMEMAGDYKHEPDGITRRGLTRGMRDILDALVTSGALVPPRTSGEESAYNFTVGQPDDDNPYVFLVEQPEIDMWLVAWSFCPTGSARRIVGQPILIK